MSTTPKLLKMWQRIGTHSGAFHCDEALACFMLLELSPSSKSVDIIRSRDQKILDTCDIVVDVGGVFDPDKLRFDHHQRGFVESLSSLIKGKKYTTKLSSAGLVYAYFGLDLISKLTGLESTSSDCSLLFDKMYEGFIEAVDAIDNGISICDAPTRYSIHTDLSSRIKHMNPVWNDKNPDEDALFKSAVAYVGNEFKSRVSYYSNVWLPARGIVRDAIEKRFDFHASGRIIHFEDVVPWKEHLFLLENELAISGEILYVIYKDKEQKFRIQCVSISPDSFENRLSLPEQWRGLRDDVLSNIAGIENCVFVHSNGFIGGNKTKSGILEMAVKSLAMGSGDGKV